MGLASLALRGTGGLGDVSPSRFARPSWNRGFGGCIPLPHPLINITLISPYLILQSGDTSP